MPNTASSAPIWPSRSRFWLLDAPWISRNRVQDLFDTDPWRGWFGRYISLAAAYLWCFFVTWPVSIVEFAGVPLLVCTLLRMHRNWRYIPSIFLQPLPIAAAVFGLVQLASGLWTLDHRQWVEQAGAMRWLWSLFVLWPLIQHRRGFITAICLGAVVGNLTQLSQYLHVNLGWSVPTWSRAPDRYSGWWPPVVCGTVLTGILGLHLPAVFVAVSGRVRAFGIAGSLITLVCIFASGTRGAWLASLGLIILTAGAVLGGRIFCARSSPSSPLFTKRTLAISCIAIAVLIASFAAAWSKLGDSISRRFELARQEIHAAVTTGEYRTDTGARIGMALWAIDHFKQHPVRGIGAGSYRTATQTLLTSRGVDASTQAVHDHAHNAILQIAATTGLLGLIPAIAVIVLGSRNAFTLARDRVESFGAYEWGPFCALAGLLLVSVFDPVHINAQTSALLALILSLCPTFIPPWGGSHPSRS